MVGSPRRRARRQAEQIAAGVRPEGWVDDRPMKKVPDRERGHEIVRARQGPRVGLPGVTDAKPPAEAEDFEVLLGGFYAEDLDDESNAAFERLRKLGFQFAQEVMELPLVATDKNFTKILGVKLAITQTVFTATTRVRPGDLREKDDDGVGALLEQVRAQEAGGHTPGKPSDDAEPEPVSPERQAAIDLLS